MAISDHLEHAEDMDTAVSAFNAGVYQLLGDAASDASHCDSYSDLGASWESLQRHMVADEEYNPAYIGEAGALEGGAYKAARSKVPVKTKLGVREETVPST